ncbi:Sodium- and chloride-dependent taurine transporter [Lamellibrachia satsuma]|nr:Sodium- and chloride-dependent taurine transporter [Lamellibrachia satsuma]
MDITSPPAYNDVETKSVASTEDGKPKRETWSRKIDFLLACIGFSVGLGNVWRFPYLCYKNGGVVFLIPYFIFVLIGGLPLFYLEVAIGQFMSQGGITAWKICPIFQGIGWATTVVIFYINCYYNVILAWSFYYMFASFTTKLPWEGCNNTWNTVNCSTFSEVASRANNSQLVDSTTEFWERKVLGISDSITEVGTIKWDLALCLLFAWFVILVCIWNGIKTSGKVMYFTATSPYIFMFILLIRGCMLPGALEGIKFYIWSDDWMASLKKLGNLQVLVDAGTQIFFSSSISLGALTALGSYNKFKHDSYRDSMIFAATNSCTSILAGFVIFSVLGFMAHEQGVEVSAVAESGPGLAFIAYPKAVSQLPAAPIWSILFFFMLILLGLDSQFVGVEGFVTACVDAFPILQSTKNRHIFLVCTCIANFCVGLTMVTNGGMYVFQLMDYYSGSRIVMLIACCECMAIAWTYGLNRFYDNVEMMLGYRPNPYMWICWLVISPCFCMVIFLMSIVEYSELDYSRPSFTYKYPGWAVSLGWGLAGSSAICIPFVAIYNTFALRSKGKPWISVLQPQGLKPHQLRPKDLRRQKQLDGFENTGYEMSTSLATL